jgi:integrase
VQQFTGTGKYVFPSFKSKDRPMSDNILIGALRRMGYTKEEFVPHSFRAMFSTIAYENANSKDGIISREKLSRHFLPIKKQIK